MTIRVNIMQLSLRRSDFFREWSFCCCTKSIFSIAHSKTKEVFPPSIRIVVDRWWAMLLG